MDQETNERKVNPDFLKDKINFFVKEKDQLKEGSSPLVEVTASITFYVSAMLKPDVDLEKNADEVQALLRKKIIECWIKESENLYLKD